MHDEILNDAQRGLLPLMSQFRREFYLVGGTAIALHIGHRRSVDFDLFKPARLNHKRNLDRIAASRFPHQVTRRVEEQMNLIVNGVKVTFFQYPFPYFSVREVSQKATALFGELFSEKLFRAQLSYFADIDYSEEVDYLVADPPSDEDVRAALTSLAIGDI